MCNAWEEQYKLGREAGLEKGREEGLEKGREEGLEKGREEGRREIARRLVDDLRAQKSDEEICIYLQKMIGISHEQAEAYLVMAH